MGVIRVSESMDEWIKEKAKELGITQVSFVDKLRELYDSFLSLKQEGESPTDFNTRLSRLMIEARIDQEFLHEVIELVTTYSEMYEVDISTALSAIKNNITLLDKSILRFDFEQFKDQITTLSGRDISNDQMVTVLLHFIKYIETIDVEMCHIGRFRREIDELYSKSE